jgi:hypothetical protein
MSEQNDTAPVSYRPITEAPNYRVGDDGSVWRLRGIWRKLNPWAHKSGHRYVGLRVNGKTLRRQVHRLVLIAFAGSAPSEKHEVCHRNGNPSDNRLSNLRWGTRRNNLEDVVLHTGKFPKSAVTLSRADDIRNGYSGKWGEKRAIARRLGISESTVGRIINGDSYTEEQ